MKKFLPFKAFFYNQEKIENLKDVIAPPYDVISPELQDDLYKMSDYNFCRVDYTKEEAPERYEVAQKVFSDWLNEKVIVQDGAPCLYFHHHTFMLPSGKTVTRKGFFAVRRIEDFSEGGVKPHEKTLDGPKQDRLNLMRATHSQFSPVFSLYSDPSFQISGKIERALRATPFMDFVTDEKERHQVWKIKDEGFCDFLNSFLSDKPVFIADGHHRYETALNYRNEVLAQDPNLADNAAARHILMYFSNMSDEGLVILPIHRALHNLPNFKLEDFLTALKTDFTVETISETDEDALTKALAKNSDTHHVFFILTKNPELTYRISLARHTWLAHDIAQKLPSELRPLDVTVLHRLVFEHILGLTEEAQARQDNIIYWKSTEKAIDETWHGTCELTFLLNPTRITDMESVASAGLKMPQKSTFFYPKIASGLFLHSVDLSQKDGF
jgi:uncharacterized protein (DUF1015 family)